MNVKIFNKFVAFYNYIFSLFSDGILDKTEFTSICRALFRNDRGHIYNIEEKQIDEIFTIFDLNKVCCS